MSEKPWYEKLFLSTYEKQYLDDVFIHLVNNKTEEVEIDRFKDMTMKLEMLSKENEALRLSNEESRRILDDSLCKEIEKNNKLNIELTKLKDYSQKLAFALEEEKKVKDQMLLRNAEISQTVQLSEKELKEQQTQNEDLFKKINALEIQLESSQENLEKLQSEQNATQLADKVKELENEIGDKNKLIRILQQNLIDVKNALQNEIKNKVNINCNISEDDISFKYMKHVLIKFLTSSEYEAQQLTKAVAALLKMNSEEEKLIKETLDRRSSWFGSKKARVKSYNRS
ncbi:hypothetical protein PGB90_006485 [Kerria lacca]